MPTGNPPNPPTAREIAAVFRTLGRLYTTHPLHVTPEAQFHALVAVVLSSRTKDPTTNAAMERLWARVEAEVDRMGRGNVPQAGTPVPPRILPQALLAIPEADIATLLNPVGFYKTKARHLRQLAALLLERHGGRVPATREELLELPGVGRKVANLILNICFATAAICVDVHVHRIVNRLGWIETQSPEQTEEALTELLPEKYWTATNLVFVNHGQQICVPVSPFCSRCPIHDRCARVGVAKSR